LNLNLTNYKTQNIFEQAFHNILEGFRKNPSLDSQNLLIVSLSLVQYADEIIEKAKLDTALINSTLSILEIKGLIRQIGNHYELS